MFSGDMYCVKSAQIQSFFRSIFSRIPSEYRKIWTKKSSVFRYFSHSERGQWHEVGSRHPSLIFFIIINLPLAWRRFLSYRNQTINFQSKSMDWVLYDRDFRHERVIIHYIFQPTNATKFCSLLLDLFYSSKS